MTFYETVVCDYCGCVNQGATIPDTWVSFDGEHYCTKYCAMTKWTHYGEDGELL